MGAPTIPIVVDGAAASTTGAPPKRKNYAADLGLASNPDSLLRQAVAKVAHLQPQIPVMTPQERAKNAHLFDVVAFTAEMWAECIGMICDGVPCVEAVKRAGIPTTVLEGFIRTDPRIRAQWEEAKLTALRRHWPLTLVEEILEDIAEGSSVKQAVAVKRGLSYVSFLKLTQKDAVIEEMYLEAKKLQAESFADDIVEESERDEDDTIETLKGTSGNIAAVNRSKLKVNTKQWLMQANAPSRFRKETPGQVNVQVNVDHATRLEEARRRREATVVEAPVAMDAPFTPVSDESDKPSWDDV